MVDTKFVLMESIGFVGGGNKSINNYFYGNIFIYFLFVNYFEELELLEVFRFGANQLTETISAQIAVLYLQYFWCFAISSVRSRP